MSLIEVSVPAAGVPDALTYELPESLWADNLVGRRVKVTLRNRPVAGVITSIESKISPDPIFSKGGIKSIEVLLDNAPVITSQQLNLCRFVASYYMAPLGEVLRLCFPPDTPRTLKKNTLPKRQKKKVLAPENRPPQGIKLNSEQSAALEQITAPGGLKCFLLEGVTGSGKTEVYIHAAQWALAQGKSVLVIAPEIALTPQLATRFASQLGEQPVMLHSALKNTERRDAFALLLEPRPHLVLGARSALFAPLHNLGLIIVDEEHDSSFKQDETPRYHARDTALWRAAHEQATIILGSATPSLESRVNAERGKLVHLKIQNRASTNSVLPSIEIIDLKSRGQHSLSQQHDRSHSDGQSLCILSAPLRQAIKETLARGEQALLFLNRRGYANLALCDHCGQLLQCPHCSVSLTFHQKTNLLQCHQCDHRSTLPTHCPHCHEGPLLCLGLGTERVEKEVELFFPDATVTRLDRDSASTATKMHRILDDVHSGRANILIGTQMSAKGHDFPNLSLVGVVLADVGLSMPDFRASERTFQLLTQVAGRAGRRERPGRVLIQTFNPKHPIFDCVKHHDVAQFSQIDAEQRKSCKQPPYVRSALIRLESMDPGAVRAESHQVQAALQEEIHRLGILNQCSLLGPAPAPLEKLRGKWRWQLYLRTATHLQRQDILQSISKLKLKKSRLIIDIDPIQML